MVNLSDMTSTDVLVSDSVVGKALCYNTVGRGLETQ
jgi:hypothetical protein